MKFYRPNGAEIAPCICSKVKHPLGVTNVRPHNFKSCSIAYWTDACNVLGNYYGFVNNIPNAIALHREYMIL